MFHEKLANN